MNAEIVAAYLPEISFAPKTEAEEVIQNVRTILTTRRGSVPLDRSFGMNTSIIDQPVNRIRALLTTDIIETVERYEPRAEVTAVDFSGDGAEGIILPRVKVVIHV
jgi:phage baseplate assembly protein W